MALSPGPPRHVSARPAAARPAKPARRRLALAARKRASAALTAAQRRVRPRAGIGDCKSEGSAESSSSRTRNRSQRRSRRPSRARASTRPWPGPRPRRSRLRRDAARPRAPRRDAAGRVRLRRLPRAAPHVAGPDHHAHRPRRGGRPRGRPGARSRRLRREAVQRAGARGSRPGGPASREAGEQRPEGAIEVGEVRLDPDRRSTTFQARARAQPQGVRPPAPADGERGLGRHARAADRRGVGHELVRIHQDARRPRERPPEEAGRRFADPRYIHTVRGVGFRFAGTDEL